MTLLQQIASNLSSIVKALANVHGPEVVTSGFIWEQVSILTSPDGELVPVKSYVVFGEDNVLRMDTLIRTNFPELAPVDHQESDGDAPN